MSDSSSDKGDLAETDSIDEVIGRNLRDLRKQFHLTQSDVAVALGVTYQQVQKYESGISRISAATLFKVANAFDAPVGSLFDGILNQSSLVVGRVEPNPELKAQAKHPGGIALARHFISLGVKERRLVIRLARSLANGEPPPSD